ncbi:putative GTP-binding protein EngB [Fulvitalea axinellae]|uniref:Probable GTP-binding protein EngB n=1 Tax=Fulvitalea axinellae TaxID=1182444 RepID=A0AAU9CG85_9BACT|nr:putative GTP-binding protein EngB [Fulvitalea axinellae]
MKIKHSEFVISNTDFNKCPKADKPEYAFIGRSNVGKSSLINMLMGRKQLAKVSGRPGKTQLINHFIVNNEWYLVDLPGYGWAKVSKTDKSKWAKMTKDYLENRENLACVFVLIDSRHEPQKIDLEFISYLGENRLPFAMIFTKTDKQSPNKSQSNMAKFRKALAKDWENIPPCFLTSSAHKTGRDEVLDFIEEINGEFEIDED